MNLFEVKVEIKRLTDNGEKLMKESYLFDAVSFGDAEYKVIEEVCIEGEGAFEVLAIKRSNISEIVDNEEGELYFNCKLNFITLDERSGKEKKQPVYYLVKANTVAEANNRLNGFMKGTLADYSIESVTETKILEVYK